ncbi:MAG TPA: hypothetical protein VHV08_06995 [Pirellulales bacterium]|jgi:hypothetical protein|nr:hypothetical protein [Pirellulales bacterium]
MNKILYAVVACAALSLLSANSLITQDEALVSAALASLKFESVPGKPGIVGAPPKFKVTQQTMGFLEKLSKEGKEIEIQGNGSLRIIAIKK